MIVGVARITLTFPAAQSLKDKRSVIKSLLARLQNRFNVSAAEVAAQDRLGNRRHWHHLCEYLGGTRGRNARAAIRFVEANGAEYYVSDVQTETITAL